MSQRMLTALLGLLGMFVLATVPASATSSSTTTQGEQSEIMGAGIMVLYPEHGSNGNPQYVPEELITEECTAVNETILNGGAVAVDNLTSKDVAFFETEQDCARNIGTRVNAGQTEPGFGSVVFWYKDVTA